MHTEKLRRVLDEIAEALDIVGDYERVKAMKFIAKELGVNYRSIYNVLNTQEYCTDQLAHSVLMFKFIVETKQYHEYIKFKIKNERKSHKV